MVEGVPRLGSRAHAIVGSGHFRSARSADRQATPRTANVVSIAGFNQPGRVGRPEPVPLRRRNHMRMRKGAPLLFALLVLLSAAQAASASFCGAGRFSIFKNANCDAQCCYSSCQQQNRVCYKLVFDTVEQKRFHTTYQTVCETVNKQVTRTCFKDECKTMYRDCHVTKYKDVVQECYRPVQRTCYKEVQCTTQQRVVEHCCKDVKCVTRRCVPKCCEKDCYYTVCVPKYEQHCRVQTCQVQKQICETHCREVCNKVCRQVCEQRCREVCCQVSKCLETQCMKQVCVPMCRDVTEQCVKTVTRRWCEPVTTMKTVTKRHVECVDVPIEPCASPGLFGRGLPQRQGCCDNQGGIRLAQRGGPCGDPCIDPCSGKCFHLFDRVQRRGGDACGDACGPQGCNKERIVCSKPMPATRKQWHVRCVEEQVPCTTYVTRCCVEKVPYTVCRKERYNEMRNVPYTVRRMARGA